MQQINNLYPQLHKPHNTVITMHQKPDGDAMGSALGLYHFLHQLGHTITVISPTNWATFLNWMPGIDIVLNFEQYQKQCITAIQSAQWLFCLDFNILHRTKSMEPFLTTLPCIKILIDHHQQPATEQFQLGISDTTKSSTCEMIYDFIISSGNEDKINDPIAQCLYTGVMTDTGSFRFAITSSAVHRMVAHLKDKGFNHTLIHEAIYDNFLETRLRFLGYIFLHKLDIRYEHNTALIAISKEELLAYNITQTGDTEGIVNYAFSIKGIRLAALIIERETEIRCSFRSKGSFDVNTFARTYFKGGGHYNAAGGISNDSLEKTVGQFWEAVEKNTEQLQ